jgi:5-guanidino-2-oxopentanoate decarboxylase
VILLWNNQALGQIRDDMVARNIEPIGVLPKAPRFEDLCKGFNCPYAKAQNLSDLENLLRKGFNSKGPFLIELTPDAIKD